MYFSVIRNEDEFKQLSDKLKLQQDLAFLNHMSAIGKELSKTSFLFWWFPRDVQVVIERLFQTKPVDLDLGGLLGAIMIAGLEFDDDEYLGVIITALYRTENNSQLYEGAQNLAVLLFGITSNDVSNTLNTETNSPVLTTSFFYSVFVFQNNFVELASMENVC